MAWEACTLQASTDTYLRIALVDSDDARHVATLRLHRKMRTVSFSMSALNHRSTHRCRPKNTVFVKSSFKLKCRAAVFDQIRSVGPAPPGKSAATESAAGSLRVATGQCIIDFASGDEPLASLIACQ